MKVGLEIINKGMAELLDGTNLDTFRKVVGILEDVQEELLTPSEAAKFVCKIDMIDVLGSICLFYNGRHYNFIDWYTEGSPLYTTYLSQVLANVVRDGDSKPIGYAGSSPSDDSKPIGYDTG